LNKNYTI